ncbi:hypothetical protein J4G08_21145 [Candidatus Poribacteria bacterium]|nr:hypothetical protein [Candidatus Poribacteria bacterium]
MFSNTVDSIAYSPNGKTVAGVGKNGKIRLWDVETGKHKQTFAGHKWIVNSLTFSPNRKTLASGSTDGTILLWEVP